RHLRCRGAGLHVRLVSDLIHECYRLLLGGGPRAVLANFSELLSNPFQIRLAIDHIWRKCVRQVRSPFPPPDEGADGIIKTLRHHRALAITPRRWSIAGAVHRGHLFTVGDRLRWPFRRNDQGSWGER